MNFFIICVTEEYDRDGQVVFDCIFLLQKKTSDYAKREIRTSLPSLGNITMCIFSPARIAFLSLSLPDQDRPPLWRHHHHAPPSHLACPPQNQFRWSRLHRVGRARSQPPEAALLLFCAFLHFQSVGWGATGPIRSWQDCADQSEASLA